MWFCKKAEGEVAFYSAAKTENRLNETKAQASRAEGEVNGLFSNVQLRTKVTDVKSLKDFKVLLTAVIKKTL